MGYGINKNRDYFRIYKSNKGGEDLDYYINRINFSEYHIYKSTNRFKEVTVRDFKEFKHAIYIFFLKDKYSNTEINETLIKINEIGMTVKFLDKPLPKLEIIKKIKVIDGI